MERRSGMRPWPGTSPSRVRGAVAPWFRVIGRACSPPPETGGGAAAPGARPSGVSEERANERASNLHQFDARHVGAVALAGAEPEDARVAAVALQVAGRHLVDQLVRHFAVAEVTLDLA